MTAALALKKIGASVEIIEQSEVLGEVGAGLQLSANAVHVLAALGLEDAISETACRPQNAVMRHYRTGREELSVPLGQGHETRYGKPYFHIHRADLHKALERAALSAGVKVHLGAAITGYVQDGTSIIAHADGCDFAGDALIGADGIRSAVQTMMLGPQDPEFTGQIAWRGLVDASRFPEGIISMDATAWLGPGQHFVAYYVRGGALINFIAVQERDEWTEEDWHKTGDYNILRNAFEGWDPRVTQILDASDAVHLWGLFDRPPLEKWTDGRAALLGDACHPMLPFMAQGAAMAIEDAYVLAKSVKDNPESIPFALEAYARDRQTRTAMLQAISRQNAKMFHRETAPLRALRRASFGVATLLPAVAHNRFDKIYGVDVTQG